MFDIQGKKGRDYGEVEDALKNLRRRGRTGVLARMGDKLTRLENLLQPGRSARVEDETVEDTLLDLANYSLLLIILMWDEEGKLPEKKAKDVLAQRKLDTEHHIEIVYKTGSAVPEIHLVKTTNDTIISEEEPVILFRGRDRLALPMLQFYRKLWYFVAPSSSLESMDEMLGRFTDFKESHSEVMKQPGITLGK